MRTTNSRVTFRAPFTLNKDIGELPAGTYDIEVDEEEMRFTEHTAYRRAAIYFCVEGQGSTRTLVIPPSDLDAAVKRDAEERAASLATEGGAPIHPGGTLP
jgi:hypothetical protein